MKILGFEITRHKALPTPTPTQPGSWFGNWMWPAVVREPFTGAWQRNIELRGENITTYHAVYSCITLIASDVAKCRLRLMEMDSRGIWKETTSPSFSPVLRKPNGYQNRIQFFESWTVSKLINGNTYVLKDRDQRGIVTRLYVLEPTKTRPLVAPDGSIFYQLTADNLSGIGENVTVPASEIIHDVSTLRYHPLCGVPPLAPAALAAIHGLNIQRNSASFFDNGGRPGGVLTAPGMISDDTARRLKEHWEANYTGDNAGRIAVLGDGLKFEAMAYNAVDSQLIEQLNLTAKMVCSAFNVPAYMVGVGDPPSYNNIEALNQQYYNQTLQKYFEAIELCLDEGLGLVNVPGVSYGTAFDLSDLLRMDSATKAKTWVDLVRGGIAKPNEAREQFDMAPVTGGDTPYLQHQDYSLAALAKRDAKDDPFATSSSEPSPADDEPDDDLEDEEDDGEERSIQLKELLLQRSTELA